MEAASRAELEPLTGDPVPAEPPRLSAASHATTQPPSAPPVRPAQAAPAPVAAAMDRDFIARNQIVERYLSGKLPIKGATEFERFCAAHPELLDELGLPDRVHAGLRLLEASGKPEPWREQEKRLWEKPHFVIALGAVALVLLVLSGV